MGDDEGARRRNNSTSHEWIRGCCYVLGVIIGVGMILGGSIGLLITVLFDNNFPSSSFWSTAGATVIGVIMVKVLFHLSNRKI